MLLYLKSAWCLNSSCVSLHRGLPGVRLAICLISSRGAAPTGKIRNTLALVRPFGHVPRLIRAIYSYFHFSYVSKDIFMSFSSFFCSRADCGGYNEWSIDYFNRLWDCPEGGSYNPGLGSGVHCSLWVESRSREQCNPRTTSHYSNSQVTMDYASSACSFTTSRNTRRRMAVHVMLRQFERCWMVFSVVLLVVQWEC